MKLIIIAILLTSCTPMYLVSKSDFNSIPKGSKKVIATVSYGRDSLYSTLSVIFAGESCPVHNNREAMQIYCDGKSIEGGTLVKSYAFIETTSLGSRVTFTGEWGLNSDGQISMKILTGMQIHELSPIVFEKTGTSKPDVAYQYLILLARKIPGSAITYSK